MIGEKIIRRVQTIVINADDYLEEKKVSGKKKQKWFGRRDIVIWGFILLVGVLLFAIPPTSTQAPTPASGTKQFPGKGGVDAAQCASVPIPPCHSIDNTTGPITQSVDPNTLVDNWNNTGQSVTSQTYNSADPYADNTNNGDFLTDPKTGSLFFTNPGYTVDNQDIRGLWITFTEIVGFFLVIAVIFSGYKIMFGGGGFRYAAAVENLPRALLAGISAFMSLVFIALVLTISNGLNRVVLDYMYTTGSITIQDIVMPAKDWQNYITILLTDIANMFQGNVAGGIPFGGIATVITTMVNAPDLVGNMRNFIWLLLTLLLASQVILRLATLNLYIVASPLAFICGAFPSQQGQQVARSWATGFFATLFVQFAQILALYVGWIVFNSILHPVAVQTFYTIKTQGGNHPEVNTYIDNLAPLVTLWFALRVPRLFNSSAMQSITSAGSVITGAMRSAIGVAGI